MKTSSIQLSLKLSRLKKLKSSTPQFRTGIPVIRMEKVVFSILSQSEVYARVITRKFHGLRSRPVQLSRGNIPAVFCVEIIQQVNSTLLPCLIISSRRIRDQ